jgi:hypothetical protein
VYSTNRSQSSLAIDLAIDFFSSVLEMINRIPLPLVDISITSRKKCRSGYVKVKVVGHPMADEKGWVWEHRLVIACHIGRCIFLPEIVHHKDRNKANNAIENLELFSSDYEHSLEHQRMDRKKAPVHWEKRRKPTYKKKYKTHNTSKADYIITRRLHDTPPPEFAAPPAQCLGLKQRMAARRDKNLNVDSPSLLEN